MSGDRRMEARRPPDFRETQRGKGAAVPHAKGAPLISPRWSLGQMPSIGWSNASDATSIRTAFAGRLVQRMDNPRAHHDRAPVTRLIQSLASRNVGLRALRFLGKQSVEIDELRIIIRRFAVPCAAMEVHQGLHTAGVEMVHVLVLQR